ncbi:MAG: SDR family oxidoreductase [Candidatus Diapherotrites archaeon]|nr:SDR family oxidoreductase [Candidatus Diapherotrites archaeon]
MAFLKKTAKAKTALVTGASGGIGLEFAKIFAQESHDIVMVARDREKLVKNAEEIREKHGVQVIVVVLDLARPGSAQKLFNELEKKKIRVDVLVNNAGFGVAGFFHEESLEKQLEMIQLNVATLVELTYFFANKMVERRSGKILNVSSTAAFQPGPLMAVYYASKAFVLSFSEALRNELGDSGISVTALCPGPTESGFQERADIKTMRLVRGKRLMSPAVVAAAGFDGLMKNKSVVIPGLRNFVMAYAVRVLPRDYVTKTVRRIQEKI